MQADRVGSYWECDLAQCLDGTPHLACLEYTAISSRIRTSSCDQHPNANVLTALGKSIIKAIRKSWLRAAPEHSEDTRLVQLLQGNYPQLVACMQYTVVHYKSTV